MEVKGLDPQSNLRHMCELIDRVAADGNHDLIVFPELANSGYVKTGDPEFRRDYLRCGEKIPGTFTNKLGEQAKKYGVYIVSGLLETHPHIPYALYNSAVLIGPSGDIIGVQHKIHLPLPERNFFYPGGKTDVFAVELGNIALQICADGAFPELSRIFALKGAEIVCTPYCAPSGRNFEERIPHSAACRAMENMNFYIASSRVGSDASGSFVGHSCIAGPMGHLLAASNSDKEEIITTTLEEEKLIEARGYSLYLSYRRPELYTLLTEPYT